MKDMREQIGRGGAEAAMSRKTALNREIDRLVIGFEDSMAEAMETLVMWQRFDRGLGAEAALDEARREVRVRLMAMQERLEFAAMEAAANRG